MANDILVKVGADITQFSKAMAKANKSVKEFGDKNKETFDSFKNVGGAITGVGVAISAGLGLAVNEAIKFESSFAGVRKTVDATEAEFEALEKGVRDMAKELPASVHEINGVAEAAGQLGIKKDNILDFTRVMIDLGEATNLSSEEAAMSFAQFANIVDMSQQDFSKLGSSVVALGNNMATTESDIVAMSMRLAAQGKQIGLSEAEIMALSSSMSSLGIEAEAGGTAMTMVMKKIQNAVADGGKGLEGFAKAAGMSSKEFADAFNNEPITAIDAFIKGMAESSKNGKNLNDILDDLGIKGIREADTVLRLAGNAELLSDAVGISSKAWQENTALSNEAEQRYKTLEAKLKILRNTFIDAAKSIGDALLPAISFVTDFLKNLVEKFNGLSDSSKNFIAISVAVVSALALIIGPILLLIGFIPAIISGFGAIATVFGVTSAVLLKGVLIFTGIFGAIVALGIALVIAYNKVDWFREMVDAAWAKIKEAFGIALEWIKGIVVAVMTEVGAFIDEILGEIRELWAKYGDTIMNNVRLQFENIKNIISAVMGVIKGIFQVVWPIISGIVKIAWGSIKTAIRNALDLISGIIDTVMALIRGDWEGAWTSIKETVENIWDNIVTFFEEVDLEQIGKDIIAGLIKGIGSMGSSVWEAVKGIGRNIKEGFTNFFSIHSPSRLMISLAKHIPGGVIKGIESMTGKVKAATTRLSEAMTPETPSVSMSYATPSGTYASLSQAIEGNVDVSNSRDSEIASAINELRRDMTNLRVEINEREFGRLVSDTTTDARNSAVRNGGRRRV